MYRPIELAEPDCDLNRFIWRPNSLNSIGDYHNNYYDKSHFWRVCFANMCIIQKALNLAHEFLPAAEAVQQSCYVDNGLTGADDLEGAIELQRELQGLFSKGGFLLS